MHKNRIALSLLLLAATSASAQVSANATASATIVTPISITRSADMNFGNIAVSVAGGTVVLSPAGSRTGTGGVTLPATAGTVTAAAFTVAGIQNYTYAITLPEEHFIFLSSLSMRISAFTSTPSLTGNLTDGTQTLEVGATLEVNGNQPAGLYTSATPFEVTVNYN